MKFSIIIPVYNTKEKFIRECIESIINQTYQNFEIIIVDDGSNQVTKEILLEESTKDNRIIVYSIENAGVSNARNYGTLKAKGDYIIYVDSDDFISEEYLMDMFNILKNKLYDVIYSQITFDEKNLKKNTQKIYESENIKEILKKYFLSFENKILKNDISWLNRGPVCRCIKKNIAIANKFDKNISFGEDVLWNFELLNKVENMIIFLKPEYYYRKNDTSATSSYRENFEIEMKKLLTLLKKNSYSNNIFLKDEYATACFEYYRIYLKLCLFNVKNKMNFFKKNSKLKDISKYIQKEINGGKIIYESLNFKAKILLILYKLNLNFIITLIESR